MNVVPCKKCIFWFQIDPDDEEMDEVMGDCRIKSPCIVQNMSDPEGAVTSWPQTESEDFCGEGTSLFIKDHYLHGPYEKQD